MKETHIFKVDIDTEERFIDFIHISKLHFLKWHQAIMTNTPKDIQLNAFKKYQKYW